MGLPIWWYVAGSWYSDPDFIKEFPGALDRAERVGAVFHRSFTTIKRYSKLWKEKRAADPGWAARVFNNSTAAPHVPPVVTSLEEVSPPASEAGASSVSPPPVVASSEDVAPPASEAGASSVSPPPVVASSEDVAPPASEAGASSELPPSVVASSEDVAPPASEAGASSELPPPVVFEAPIQSSNKEPAHKAVSKNKIKAISKRRKQPRKVQAPSDSSDSDGFDGTSSPKPDYVDPCENPRTPAARFARRYGFLRMRLLPSDVARLQILFERDITEQDIENMFQDPTRCFTPAGASARVILKMKKDHRVGELREIVLRTFNTALGGNGLHFKYPNMLGSRPLKTTRMKVHRDWPCAHSDLRLAFNINVSPPPRVLYLFSGSHIEGSTLDSLPIGVETAQWEIIAWDTSLFHAGPPNFSPLWQCTLHGTVSNLANPRMNPKTNKLFGPSHVRMNLLKQERDIHDSHPAREIKCRAKTDGEEWLWIAQQ